MHKDNRNQHAYEMLDRPETLDGVFHDRAHIAAGKIPVIAFHKVQRETKQELEIAGSEEEERVALITGCKITPAIHAAQTGEEAEQAKEQYCPTQDVVGAL